MNSAAMRRALSERTPIAVRHWPGKPLGSAQHCVYCKLTLADWTGCKCGLPTCADGVRWTVGEPVVQVGVALARVPLPSVPCPGLN